MKSLYFIFLIIIFIMTSCSQNNPFPMLEVRYPETEKKPVADKYFEEEVIDLYRWLEDDMAEKTAEWVKKQNVTTYGYLEQIPFRESIRERLNVLSNYENYSYLRDEYRLSLPIIKNGKCYYFKNSGLDNHAILYAIDLETGKEDIVLDPNSFSEDGTTSVADVKFSPSGGYMAYSISEGGADWRKIIVVDTKKLKVVGDTITDVKFTSITWKDDEGFYYSSYDKPEEGSSLSAITDKHKVYYHRLQTPQSDDQLIFGNKNEKRRYVDVKVFKSSDYLFLNAAESTSGNELYFKRIGVADAPFSSIVEGFDTDNKVIYAAEDMFLAYTNLNAPNGRIVKVGLQNPSSKYWVDLIPEENNAIESVTQSAGYIFVNYLKHAVSYVKQFTLEGEFIRDIKLPGIGSVSGFVDSNGDDKKVFYSFESFTEPYSIYILNPETGVSELFRKPELSIDASVFETKQVFYESKDGTNVPMFIISKKGTKLNSNNPVLLYGYGGFNISLSPYYSSRWLAWLDLGGIVAIANLRGGGEYGDKWHKAGMQMNKQNVFDDFIAAAEYLKAEGYTKKEKLSVMGGSNGGLLVGATITQRPDLVQVALPSVGVLDMLRYHKFTAGAGWISDYGCADSSKAMFQYLKAYSPVHNVKKGTSYPATLVTTGDHDDRVVPAHSFKFISHLQDKNAGNAPVLIRIETKGGHGAGKSLSMYLDELADSFTFALYNMKTTPVYFEN